MSDERAERLARELEAAFRNRADLYRLMWRELGAELGADRARTVMARIIAERGREVARAAFAGFARGDAVAIGEAFLAASPDGGRLYPTRVERGEGTIAFQVERCPLKDAWIEAGVAPGEMAVLCDLAGAFDRGLFEETGVTFENRTWREGLAGCCFIRLSRPD